jgi:hypothetical protein
VERLLAGLFPLPDVPSSIRPVPSSRAQTLAIEAPIPIPAATPTPIATPVAGQPSAPPIFAAGTRGDPPADRRRALRDPLHGDGRDAGEARQAQDLLGHAVPSGDLAEVFDRALTLLVADLERKKFAATSRPRKSRGQPEDSRNIPADVRRAAWARDEGRCAFVASDGRRCSETRALEFHHVHPYGAHGKPTVANIQLRCRSHNRYEAELYYGPARRYAAGDVVSESMAVY